MKRSLGFLAAHVMTVATLIGSGCSAVKNMQDKTDDMAKTTHDLNDKTTQVVKTSQDLDSKSTDLDNKTTDVLALSTDMDRETNSLYIKARQGNALEVRKDMLNQMNKAETMESKISFAGAYFMAFEYQLWGGSKEDDQARLEGLYKCAMEEFFREAKEYMPEDYKHNPKVDPTKTDNKSMNLYALAVTMHEKNTYEEKQLIDPSNPNLAPDTVSMYDLLLKGLGKRVAMNNGEVRDKDLKDWQKEVLNDAQAFEYLIRVRENFLPVMTLAQISRAGEKGPWIIPGLLRLGTLRAGWMLLAPFGHKWTADLEDLNTEQLITFTKWISDPLGALGARQALENLNADASLNPTVAKIYRNMRIDEGKLPKADLIPQDENLDSPLVAFKKAVGDMLQ